LKPPPFAYDDPRTLDDALALLADRGDEAKVLAGGQSLVPLLNFRLARPDRIVDVNGVTELDYLRIDGGTLRIGALTRQAELERSADVAASVPLLTEAVRQIGHVQIRNRGTIGGSVAHADPAAELPAAFTALDARLHVRSARGARAVPAGDFFVTHLTTVLEPDELLTELEVPLPAPGTGAAVVEYARRHGDFALGGAAVLVRLAGGACASCAIALLAAGPRPLRAREAEAALAGRAVDEAAAADAAAVAVRDLHPTGDIHGSSDYRRGLVQAMVRRALLLAAERAEKAQ
jgi:CO/xanthine dehydrogenase FAD-binding subunit